MRNVTAALDRIADSLEKVGLVREAYEVDRVSDALEAAQSPLEQTEKAQVGQRMPEITQTGMRPTQRMPSPPPQQPGQGAQPRAGQIIMNSRDSFDTQMTAVESALIAVGGLFDTMSAEAAKVFPQRTGVVSSTIQKSKEKLKLLLEQVKNGIKGELQNFLLAAGGKEEASSFSVDYLRFASKKTIDKPV